jgi:putative aldouronate transport system permease protein
LRTTGSAGVAARRLVAGGERGRQLKKSLVVYALLLPGFAYFAAFKYVPMWGLLLAFKNYKPIYGFWNSRWVGLANFSEFFTNSDFPMLLYNTFRLALNSIFFFFPLPIILALLLHEVGHAGFKRTVQSVIYVPHFISWVVVAGISQAVLGDEGLFNSLLASVGVQQIPFLYSPRWLRATVLLQIIWKESGWGTIIFVAALTGVNPDLYEAATIDGANRLDKLWHVTLPALKQIIVLMLILRVGRFLDTGFEQIFLLLNAMNRNVGEVFDTYAYEMGILQGRFSYAITASIFKSVVGFALVLLSDRLAKRAGQEGIL